MNTFMVNNALGTEKFVKDKERWREKPASDQML